MKKLLSLIAIVVVLIVVFLLVANYVPFPYSGVTKVTDLHPTPTAAPTPMPLFSITLAPSTQTVVPDLYQIAKINVEITGNPTYPCSITVHGGSSSYEPKYTVYGSGVINGPNFSTANSKTYVVTAGPEPSGVTRTYYTTVVDSLGNTYSSSNQIQVTYR